MFKCKISKKEEKLQSLHELEFNSSPNSTKKMYTMVLLKCVSY